MFTYINHSRRLGRLATGITVALVVLPVGSTTAEATSDGPAGIQVARSGTTTAPDALTRPCFLERAHWNVALDGSQPRC